MFSRSQAKHFKIKSTFFFTQGFQPLILLPSFIIFFYIRLLYSKHPKEFGDHLSLFLDLSNKILANNLRLECTLSNLCTFITIYRFKAGNLSFILQGTCQKRNSDPTLTYILKATVGNLLIITDIICKGNLNIIATRNKNSLMAEDKLINIAIGSRNFVCTIKELRFDNSSNQNINSNPKVYNCFLTFRNSIGKVIKIIFVLTDLLSKLSLLEEKKNNINL